MLVQRMEALELHINKLNCLDATLESAKSKQTASIQPKGDQKSAGDDDDDLFGSNDEVSFFKS